MVVKGNIFKDVLGDFELYVIYYLVGIFIDFYDVGSVGYLKDVVMFIGKYGY